MQSAMEFIDAKNASCVNDRSVKNKWRWEWLNETDSDGVKFDSWCRKINVSGFCYCVECNKKLNYGSNGKKVLLKHSNDAAHKKWMDSRKHVATFPGVAPVQAKASLCDRIAHQKAMITAFLCENMLPFSLAPKLVELCQKLGDDKLALSKLKISRTTATYINTHGTAKCMRKELVEQLRGNFFSLNIDESTNNSMDKILNVLVRFYDENQKAIVTDHLGSKKENFATATNLFQRVKDLLTEHGLDFSQVVSCLMDNCNTMRGSKGGVETLIRKENPHLLDIHGDVVHIANNSAKMFFQHFDNFIEGFANDVYYDIRDSPKSKQMFFEIQDLLNMKQKQILRPVDTRFLQLLNVCNRLNELKDAFIIYYSSFLSSEEKNQSAKSLMEDIFRSHKVSDEQAKRVTVIQCHLSKQKLSDASKTRKKRILLPLVHLHKKFMFHLNFYRGILVKFDAFIKMFQRDSPMLHRIHCELFSLCKQFLTLFIRPEYIPEYNMKELLSIDVKNKDMQVSDKFLSVGNLAYLDVLDLRKKKANWIPSFYRKLREAYEKTSIYMLRNLPLKNDVLTWVSALSPQQRKCSTTLLAFDKLGESLPQVISDKERGFLIEEVRHYSIDAALTELEKNFDNDKRIDCDWWTRIFEMKKEDGTLKYKFLSVLVKALLSIFTGPLVEGTFNIMDDIVTNDRSCLTVENYEAASIVKYSLRRKNMKSTDLKLSSKMCEAIHSAYASYRASLSSKKLPLCDVNKVIAAKPSSIRPSENILGFESSSLMPSASLPTPTSSTSTISISANQTAPSNLSLRSSNSTASVTKPIPGSSTTQSSKKRPASEINGRDASSKKSKCASASITKYFLKK